MVVAVDVMSAITLKLLRVRGASEREGVDSTFAAL